MLTQKQQIFDQINKASNILITFSRDWSGDAVASALALFLVLQKMDKKVIIAADKNSNAIFSFLPKFDEIKNSISNMRNFVISLDLHENKIDNVKYKIENNKINFIISPRSGTFEANDISASLGGFNFDLVIALDTPDLESLGQIYENHTDFFYHVPIINIDHHSGNEGFGQINLVEITSISTTEVLFSLISEQSRDLIDENVATCLLAGMIDKTRSFKTNNITPNSLTIASQLISMGADREKIVNKLYRSRELGVLKLWGRVLARLTDTEDGQIIWSVITENDFAKTESHESKLPEVIDELIVSIPRAKIIVLLYESRNKQEQLISKAIVYSIRNIDSIALTKEFDPIGSKKTVTLEIQRPIKDAEEILIGSISEKFKRLPLN